MRAFLAARCFAALLFLFSLMALFDKLAFALATFVTTKPAGFFDGHGSRPFFLFLRLGFFLGHEFLRAEKKSATGKLANGKPRQTRP
jgi:hypothetical protein